MEIRIGSFEKTKKQNFDLNNSVSIIYGYNNSGKTTILKAIESALSDSVKENFYKSNSALSLYIPTNRIIVSNSKVEFPTISDREELNTYKNEIFHGYEQHLKMLREHLLKHDSIKKMLEEIIHELFDTDLYINEKLDKENIRFSDGIENIINIYLNIIWILTWDLNLQSIEYSKLREILSERNAFILIDEIEMFLHVNIQEKLINIIKRDFKNCGFILTTHSPLLLTRYENTKVYNIENGTLRNLDNELFYQDLNKTFEVYFKVDSIPNSVKEVINYLGKVITSRVKGDQEKINEIDLMLEQQYPNIHQKYNSLILKAKLIGEKK